MLQDMSKQEAMVTVHYQNSKGQKAETTMAGIPALLEAGAIQAATLIWIEGMDDWTALNEAQGKEGLTKNSQVSTTLKGVLQNGLANKDQKDALLQKVWDHVDANGDGAQE